VVEGERVSNNCYIPDALTKIGAGNTTVKSKEQYYIRKISGRYILDSIRLAKCINHLDYSLMHFTLFSCFFQENT